MCGLSDCLWISYLSHVLTDFLSELIVLSPNQKFSLIRTRELICFCLIRHTMGLRVFELLRQRKFYSDKYQEAENIWYQMSITV